MSRVTFLVVALLVAGCAAGGSGDYASADLAADLEAAGATVREAGEIEQAFFSPTGRLLNVNGFDLQVFEYSEVASRQVESDQISSDGSTIGTTMITWVDQPNFWAKDLLIVLYVGQDAATIEMLSGILGEPLTGR